MLVVSQLSVAQGLSYRIRSLVTNSISDSMNVEKLLVSLEHVRSDNEEQADSTCDTEVVLADSHMTQTHHFLPKLVYITFTAVALYKSTNLRLF